MRLATITLALPLALFTMLTLTQCASYDFSRKTVQQGNLLPQDKLARLHVGMSKNDVATLMGTSLLSPMFNNDRWDYAFTLRKGNGPLQVRNVTLYFSQNKLARIEPFNLST